jgi:hypothetical protein
VALAFVCLVVPSSAFAQTELAGVYGRVTDPSGAVIVDAEVEIKNVETNVSTTVKTNADGLYNVPSLHPGHYLISVRKVGFKSVTVTQLELNIQDNVVRNFALQIGSVSETVTITSDQFHMNTTDASVSTVVDQSYIANMPLNGRSFQDLILLTPGVLTQTPQSPGTMGTTGEFSVNGQRTEENYYTVDGVSANVGAGTGQINGYSNTSGSGASGSVAGATLLGTTQALVSVDELQEFRVQSSTYSADSGRNPGAQIALQTKSGTNRWHGSAFDYFRNGFFDAQDWFNDYLKTPAPPVHQNDFGGTLGGPIQKDKTFFFVSYEGLRLRWPQAPSINIGVPNLCLRGDTATCSGSDAPVTAELLPVVNAFPLPTSGGTDFGDGTAQYIASWTNPSSINSTSMRLDRVFNDRLRLFFRFNDTGSSSSDRGNETEGPSPAVRTNSDQTMRTYTAGASTIFTARLSNDFRFNFTTNEITSNQFIDPTGGGLAVDLRPASGLGAGSSTAFCYFNAAGICVGLDQARWSAAQKQWNLVDTVSLSVGRHQLKFGGDYRRLAPNTIIATPEVGYDYFDEPSVETNSAFASVQALSPAYPLYQNFSAFGQDEWRVSPRLTLSMGLRWEINPAPGVTKGLAPYAIQGSSLDTLSVAPQGTPLWKTTWYNFAPRLGAAYVIRQSQGLETVVRGGGGVYFDSGQQMGSLGFVGPGFNSSNFVFGSYNITGSWSDFNGNTAATPAGLLLPIQNPPQAPYSSPVFSFYPHLQLPYTLHWNASIQQSLGSSQALTLSYVGAHASRLLQTNTFLDFNNPNTAIFILVQNGLTSDYGALQAQFQRRLSRGLTALGSYTWSHCIDYGSSNTAFGFQRGNCDFDIRHNFAGAFSYDVPRVGHGGFVSALLDHWGIDNRFTARTAFPVQIMGSGITASDGKRYNAGVSFVSGQPVYISGANCAAILQAAGGLQAGQGCPGGKALNPNAFITVDSAFGNTPRNFARLFGAWQMNMAIRREFPIRENLKVQFRAEAFNIFNRPNFGTVDADCEGDPSTPGCTNPIFGLATSTLARSLNTLSSLYQFGGARSMQFALKVIF